MSRRIIMPQPGRQASLLSCPADEILYGGARAGGKSYGALLDFVAHAERYGEHAKGIAFRRTIPELEDFMGKARSIMLPLGWTWAEQRRTWTSPRGGTLKMRYLERTADADGYQGHEYTWIAFEEAGNWANPEPLKRLKTCLRSAHGVKKRVILTCNPGGAGHNWLRADFVDPAPPMTLFAPPDNPDWRRCYIPSTIEDNLLIMRNDPGYRAQLAAEAPEHLRKAWLEGDWDVAAGGMFDDCWNPSQQVLKPFPVPRQWRVSMCHDWGSAAPSATIWVAEANGETVTLPSGKEFTPPRGSLICIHELYTWNGKPNQGNRWTAAQIGGEIVTINANAERAGRWRVNDDSVADSAIFSTDNGRSISDDFAAAGVHWKPANKFPGSRRQGWQLMRELLAESCKVAPERPGLYFFENCRHLIRTLPSAPRDKGDGDDIDTDSEDHLLDALRYRALRKSNKMQIIHF